MGMVFGPSTAPISFDVGSNDRPWMSYLLHSILGRIEMYHAIFLLHQAGLQDAALASGWNQSHRATRRLGVLTPVRPAKPDARALASGTLSQNNHSCKQPSTTINIVAT
jgi:hypothetical protein